MIELQQVEDVILEQDQIQIMCLSFHANAPWKGMTPSLLKLWITS